MKKLTLPLLAALALLLIVATIGTSDNATARYVSAPLPDGSRYTFLYPQRLKVERLDGTNCYLLGPNRSPNLSSKLLDLLPRRRSLKQLGIIYEEIRVNTTPQKAPYADSHDNIVGRNRQILSIENSASRSYFYIEHSGYGADEASFQTDSATLDESFRVLAPGEKTPH